MTPLKVRNCMSQPSIITAMMQFGCHIFGELSHGNAPGITTWHKFHCQKWEIQAPSGHLYPAVPKVWASDLSIKDIETIKQSTPELADENWRPVGEVQVFRAELKALHAREASISSLRRTTLELQIRNGEEGEEKQNDMLKSFENLNEFQGLHQVLDQVYPMPPDFSRSRGDSSRCSVGHLQVTLGARTNFWRSAISWPLLILSCKWL